MNPKTGKLFYLFVVPALMLSKLCAEAQDSTPEEVQPETNILQTASVEHRLDGKTPAERAAVLVRYAANMKPKDELYPKAAASAYAARLLLNVDTNYALTKLDAAVSSRLEGAQKSLKANPTQSPHLDPFDKVVLVHTYFLCKEKIPKSTALKIRDYCALYAHKVWRGYGAMNYRLMEDGAGFLAAEEWPELVDADHLNATEIQQVTRERLFGYFDEICPATLTNSARRFIWRWTWTR